MKLMNWVRASLSTRPPREESGSEFVPVRFLKLIRRHELGGLALSHLVTNPDELPDYVLGRAGTLCKYTLEDFARTGWALHPITRKQETMLERLPGSPPQEQVVVLSDHRGTVLLFDVASSEEAADVMAAAEHAAFAAARRAELEQPFAMSRYEFAGGQPGMRVVVGWNEYLNTHYAEVWDTDEESYPVARFGVRTEGLDSVAELAEVVRPYGEIPSDLIDQLNGDDDYRIIRYELRGY